MPELAARPVEAAARMPERAVVVAPGVAERTPGRAAVVAPVVVERIPGRAAAVAPGAAELRSGLHLLPPSCFRNFRKRPLCLQVVYRNFHRIS